MSQAIEIKVPDIGDYKDVPVIEVLVQPGDTVEPEQSLITLESDKAAMDVPSPSGGVVKALHVKPGDHVSQGVLILTLEPADSAGAEPDAGKGAGKDASASKSAVGGNAQAEGSDGAVGADAEAAPPAAGGSGGKTAPAAGGGNTGSNAGGKADGNAAAAPAAPAPAKGGASVDVTVPDIGDYHDVPVIEVLVKVGDTVTAEQSLVTLESDKAAMDVPSPAAGTVKSINVKVGDPVSRGALILVLESGAAASAEPAAPAASATQAASPPAGNAAAKPDGGGAAFADSSERPTAVAPAGGGASAPVDASALAQAPSIQAGGEGGSKHLSHASPSVRKFARELGVEVWRVTGTGPKGRITEADVRGYIKAAMTSRTDAAPAAAGSGAAGAGLNLLPWPKIDFAKFGPIEAQPLSRIKKISGANLHRNWVMIPHVTNNDEADITELEALRVTLNKEADKSGTKVTMLAFLIKASVAALQRFPAFNASLDGDNLVFKQYFHIGFAADTPNGLMVPVIRDADRKGILEIAKETSALAALARDGKLKSDQMQGGCFSISSLGGIGGTTFTPIINAPEVAILGVSRSTMQPVWDGKQFVPRLILPLSLSYDHRVIDGAAAARFNAYLTQILADFRRVIL